LAKIVNEVPQFVEPETRASFGLRLKEAFNGVSQTQIARQLGLSNSAVNNYVEGRIPAAEMLVKIANLTGYSIHWLITGEGPKRIYDRQVRCQTLMLFNEMGGSAKSASAAILAMEFAKRGYQTLLVDAPAGSCAQILYGPPITFGTSDVKHGTKRISPRDKTRKHIQKGRMFFETEIPELHICVSDETDKSLLVHHGIRNFKLDVECIKREYDFVVLDTTVSPFEPLNLFNFSLVPAAQILIPVRASSVYLSGLELTLELFQEAQQYMPDIQLLGAFLTMFYPSRKVSLITADKLNGLLPGKVLKTKIHESEDLAGLGIYSQSELVNKKSLGFVQYSRLADEVLNLMGKPRKTEAR
jgi:cellulose biosynthesis protein BcsQ